MKKINLKGIKIYIAGKITGDKTYKSKFAKVEKALKEQGAIIINPAKLPSGMSPADYMRICLPMVDSADLIFFLKDYKDSKGAQIEFLYADYIGKSLMFEQ